MEILGVYSTDDNRREHLTFANIPKGGKIETD